MDLKTTDHSFEEDVLKSNLPILVDFWASWCGPCRMAGPIIEGVAKKTDGNAKVFKLDVDENPETAAKYNIRNIPTVIVFRNGTVEKEMIGVQPEAAYLEAIKG